MGIQIKGIDGQYSGYSVDVARVRQKLEEQVTVQYPQDTAEISEAGKRALKNEISAMSTGHQFVVAGHLSSVSSYEYCSRFEKELTELKGDNDTKTNCFEYHVNKMVSVYEKMKANLEVKYENDSETVEYYVSEDGSIAQLTKEKELEFLQNAYEKHSLLMATSTGIWTELAENYGGVKLAENSGYNYRWEMRRAGNLLSGLAKGTGTYGYSNKEQKEILAGFGITEGHFTIDAGAGTHHYLLLENGVVMDIERRIEMMNRTNWKGQGYQAEDVINVYGKECVIDGSGHIQVSAEEEFTDTEIQYPEKRGKYDT